MTNLKHIPRRVKSQTPM